MKKKIAILQSSYIPWKGYFDIINMVDEFVLFDDVQFTRRDWRNRNRIVTANGSVWLTIPVVNKGRYLQSIEETEISDYSWAVRHWASIKNSYAKAPFFGEYAAAIETLYEQAGGKTHLSAVNRLFLEGICRLLGISTPFTWSREYAGEGQKTDRLVAICTAAQADAYLSGPSARDYIEPETFSAANVILEYMDYSGYPEYPQRGVGFEHGVSILDLLFNTGHKATEFMKSFRGEAR